MTIIQDIDAVSIKLDEKMLDIRKDIYELHKLINKWQTIKNR